MSSFVTRGLLWAPLVWAPLVLFACGDDGPAPMRGVGSGENDRGAQALVTPPTSPAQNAPTPPPPTAAPAEPTAAPENREPERDLAAELRTAIGNPTECLPTGPNTPDRVTLSVNAAVSTQGIITRVSVGGVALTREENRCFERRLLTVRVPAPVPDAPRTINTRIELERAASPATPTPPAPRSAPPG